MKRIERLLQKMADNNLAAMYVSNPRNVRYLCDFTGEDSSLFITADAITFISDGRYLAQAKEELDPSIQIVIWQQSLLHEAANQITAQQAGEVGFEGAHLSYNDGALLKSLIKCDVIAVDGWIEKLRAIKDKEEIQKTIEAVNIADLTFAHILDFISPGLTERQVATEMEHFMKLQGSEKTSFDTIVASGIRSSYPHGEASNKVIERGDMVILDFGATYQGYASDITRTIAVGEPDSRLIDMYNLVLEAEVTGLNAIRHGMTSKELDSIIRAPFIRENMNEHFNHGAGHSIGLDIHEAPYISYRSDHVFEENTIMTIEPGLYLPNVGGVRIEDDVLVGRETSKVLTKSPKQKLIVLPF